VTDQARGKITAIVITATNIQVNQAEATEDGSWITVLEGEHTFDLPKVVGQEESLGVGELAPGRYTQIRMTIAGVNITHDGEVVAGEVPSSVLPAKRRS
jgi:hypothetical protein